MKPYKEQTYYELLEIDPSATMDDIRAAYERAIRLYDAENVALYPIGDPAQVEELKKLLLEAMEILTEPDLRVEYDRSLGLPEQKRPAAAPVPAPPPEPRPAPHEVAHQVMSAPPGPAEIDARAAASRLEAEQHAVEEVRAQVEAHPPVHEHGTAIEWAEPSAVEELDEAPAQLEMTEVVAKAETVHSTAPRYSISYIPHQPAPPPPEPNLASLGAAVSQQPERPAVTPPRPMPVVTAPAAVPPQPERPAATPTQPMPVVTPPVVTAPAAVPPQPERPAATPSQPMPVITPPTSAPSEAPTSAAQLPSAPMPGFAAPGAPSFPPELPPAIGPRPESGRFPVPAAGVSAPVPPPAVSPVQTAQATPAAPPATSAPASGEHPRRITPARGLEQAPLIAQESAIAAAESALAQVSAHVAQKAREPRTAARAFELAADAVINGELLRQIRQSRGLTLQQLAERTRITTRHIENVEADKYDALPATVYLRGILMNLARELGVDPLRVAKGYLSVVEQSGRKAK